MQQKVIGIYIKAGLLAAAFWATRVVLRTAFRVYASDGGATSDRTMGRVMRAWDITSSNAIVACLSLMAMVEVGSRQLIVGAGYLSLRNRSDTSLSGFRPLTAAGDAVAPNPGQERQAAAVPLNSMNTASRSGFV